MGCAESTPQRPPQSVKKTAGNSITLGAKKSDLYKMNNMLLKIILLGDSGVGKTSLMGKFVSNKFEGNYKATIGADFLTRELAVNSKQVTLQVWDTAGQERYESLGSAFYRGADACILVFDVNNLQSFKRLEFWRDKFLVNSRLKSRGDLDDNVPVAFVLVGNKSDLLTDNDVRTISTNKALEWCQAHGDIPYIETSAKDGTNVIEAFKLIAEQSVKDVID